MNKKYIYFTNGGNLSDKLRISYNIKLTQYKQRHAVTSGRTISMAVLFKAWV